MLTVAWQQLQTSVADQTAAQLAFCVPQTVIMQKVVIANSSCIIIVQAMEGVVVTRTSLCSVLVW